MTARAKARRTPWRDNVEALTVAIVLAIVLKYFVVEAYKIPSPSMQPTLMGSPETGVFDRILVDKLSYHVRAPERFEVAVFRYPLERSKSFVKRIVGVGPEEFTIRSGDLWHRASAAEPWQILRRPRAVLLGMLRALDLGPPPDGAPSRWRPLGAAELAWSSAGRELRARGPGTARFAHDRYALESFVDSYADGYPPGLAGDVRWTKPAGMNEVGDVRVEGLVRALEGLEHVAVVLTEGERTYRLVLPGPAAPASAAPSLEVEGLAPSAGTPARASAEAFRLPAGRAVRFAFQNMDDELAFELDGHTLLTLPVPEAERARSALCLQVEGSGADFAELQVWRDVYYTSDRLLEPSIWIPEGSYYMLGDNTQDSSDSREWRYLQMSWPGPGSEGQVVQGGWRPQENPVTLSTLAGRRTFFRDEWGERHVIEAGTETRLGYARAPCVPRELVIGRALLVFWPWSWERRLARLHWVR